MQCFHNVSGIVSGSLLVVSALFYALRSNFGGITNRNSVLSKELYAMHKLSLTVDLILL